MLYRILVIQASHASLITRHLSLILSPHPLTSSSHLLTLTTSRYVREKLLKDHNCLPGFLSDELVIKYYNGFSNDVR